MLKQIELKNEVLKIVKVLFKRRPKFLVGYGYSEWGLPNYWVKALKEISIVKTIGPSQKKQDIRCCTGEDISSILNGVEFNLFIWFDSTPEFFPKGIEKLSMPKIAILTAPSIRFPWHKELMRLFDLVIINEYYLYKWWLSQNPPCKIAHLYTGAFDPTYQHLTTLPTYYDISFCGTFHPYLYPDRGKVVKKLLGICNKWKIFIGGHYYGEKYYKLIANSKIVVNIPFNKSEGMNMRTFEVLGVGRLLFNFQREESTLKDGIHLVTFNEKNFIDLIKYYLTNKEERERIASKGREEILSHHTYLHRVKRLLEIIGSSGILQSSKNEISEEERNKIYGKIYFYIKSFDLARKFFKDGEKELAPIFANLGEIDKAIKLYGGEGSLNKMELISYGNLLFERGYKEEALQVYKKSLKSKISDLLNLPFYFPWRWNWDRIALTNAQIKYLKGKGRGALNNLNRILNSFALFRVASILYEKGKWSGAFNVAQEALQKFKNFDKLWLLLGILYYKLGEIEKAAKAFKRAKTLRPLSPYISLCLEICYQKIGDKRKAFLAIIEGANELKLLHALLRQDFTGSIELFSKRLREYDFILDAKDFESTHRFKKLSNWRGASPTYFQHSRADVESLIPKEAKRILDVGCGAGRLGERLKEKGIEVIGVEIRAEVAKEARKRLDKVIQGDIEKISLPFKEEYFDCIIYADILEHLKDPWNLFLRHSKLLKKDGVIIISFPNIRNIKTIATLINRGRWKYGEAGVLDKSHLRFFTLNEIKRILKNMGFEVERSVRGWRERSLAFQERMWREQGLDQIEGINLKQLTSSEVEDLFVQQYCIRARRINKGKKKISIVIRRKNAQEYLTLCLKRIKENTSSYPYELKIIDWEQKIEFSSLAGDYIVVLHDDTVVTPKWIDGMVRCAEHDSNTGAVGVLSNHGEYKSPEELDEAASLLEERNSCKYFKSPEITNFCMLLKKEAIESSFLSEEEIFPRLLERGYSLFIARDVLVHHFGEGEEQDFLALYFKAAKEKFCHSSDKPLLSVIIPIQFLQGDIKEIGELLCQAYKKIELVLISNGKLREEKALPTQFIYLKVDNGCLGEMLNLGVKVARGKYIFYFPDKNFNQERLETFISFLEDTSYRAIYTEEDSSLKGFTKGVSLMHEKELISEVGEFNGGINAFYDFLKRVREHEDSFYLKNFKRKEGKTFNERFERAKLLENFSLYDSAAKEYKAILKDFPNHKGALLGLARVYREINRDLEEAYILEFASSEIE